MTKRSKRTASRRPEITFSDILTTLGLGKKMLFGVAAFLVAATIIIRSSDAIISWRNEVYGIPRYQNEDESILRFRGLQEKVAGLQLQSYQYELASIKDQILQIQVEMEKNPKSRALRDLLDEKKSRQKDLEKLIKEQIEKELKK